MQQFVSQMSTGRMMFQVVLGYGVATYTSYRYNQLTKAQNDLRSIEDKRAYLHSIHESTAEKYNDLVAKREFSNKLERYRRVLLSYAEATSLSAALAPAKR